MCLGKLKCDNLFGCVEFINYEPTKTGTYVINIWFDNTDVNASLEVFDLETCEKMFETICYRLVTDGYCDISKFNLDGDYINVLFS